VIGGGVEEKFYLSLGDDIRSVFLLADDGVGLQLSRAEVKVGGAEAALPAVPGVNLVGELPRLDLLAVINWLNQRRGSLVGEAEGRGLPLRWIDLKVSGLTLGAYVFEDVAAQFVRREDVWVGRLEGPGLSGTMELPDSPTGETPYHLSLGRLYLRAHGDETVDVSGDLPRDPRVLPPLVLSGEDFRYAGLQLGRLELKVTQDERGTNLESLRVTSRNLELAGDAQWFFREGKTGTEVQLVVRTDDLGAALAQLGVEGAVKQGNARVRASLEWPGGPTDFNLEDIAGRLDVRMEDGRFLDIEPGVGRLFGLLSLGTLQRRLSLDFSDLFSKGFSFDKIKGSFNIAEGNARTDDFVMDGPAARIDIVGRSGLVAKDYDQLATVTPKLTASLPVAATLAGGPAVGAAVFAVKMLLGDQVDKITRYQYAVAGSWDDPILTRLDKAEEAVTTEPLIQENPPSGLLDPYFHPY